METFDTSHIWEGPLTDEQTFEIGRLAQLLYSASNRRQQSQRQSLCSGFGPRYRLQDQSLIDKSRANLAALGVPEDRQRVEVQRKVMNYKQMKGKK